MLDIKHSTYKSLLILVRGHTELNNNSFCLAFPKIDGFAGTCRTHSKGALILLHSMTQQQQQRGL